MANIRFSRKLFEKEIGKLDETMQNKIAMFGTTLESFNDEEIEIEVFPNRPDLLSYQGFKRHGFRISVAFDKVVDEERKKAVPEGCELYPAEKMEEIIRKRRIKLAIIAVHYSEAQKVADSLARAGVKGILNFAPVRLTVPKGVTVRHIDLGVELEVLTFFVNTRMF
jgi:NADH/NAD ratio-sensing transcriptional regulator Rex